MDSKNRLKRLSKVDFFRSVNSNGTWTALCHHCYGVVGIAENKEGIEVLVIEHSCSGFDLAKRLHPANRKPVESAALRG